MPQQHPITRWPEAATAIPGDGRGPSTPASLTQGVLPNAAAAPHYPLAGGGHRDTG